MEHVTDVELPDHLIDFSKPEYRRGFRLWVEALADVAGEPVPWASPSGLIGKAHDPCPCPAPALHVVGDLTSGHELMPGHELVDTRRTGSVETCHRCHAFLFRDTEDGRICACCGSPPKARRRARSRTAPEAAA